MLKIYDNIYLSDHDGARPEAIKANKIKIVFSVCTPNEAHTYSNFGNTITHFICNIMDAKPIPHTTIDLLLKLIEEGVNHHVNILLHCSACISRSPSITAAFLTYHFRSDKRFSSLQKTLTYLRKINPSINPTPKLWNSIEKYFLEFD